MKTPAHIQKYLDLYAEPGNQPFHCGAVDGIDCAVVIPALAEKDLLFSVLAGLATNPEEDLNRTLVLCVINNRRVAISQPDDIRNNQETLCYLKAVQQGRAPAGCSGTRQGEDIRRICESRLRLAFVDASSEGHALPEKNGGVGLARKIGMDRALALFDYAAGGAKRLCCLDADTLVESNYLTAIRDHFSRSGTGAAVVGYAHQETTDPRLQEAICCYEIFLRYYVCGLQYAASPYAFHTIGSTMACTADAYVSVRGMNRRDAAEDFYFLNKLAKIGPIGRITATTVYPSPRVSGRVPFGTGRRMIRFLEGNHDEYGLYDPAVFLVLKRWIQEVTSCPDRDGDVLQGAAELVHPLLAGFLEQQGFATAWQKIRKNSRDAAIMRRQFHVWFDGFKTLKLIHYLSERGLPPAPMFDALEAMPLTMKCAGPIHNKRDNGAPSIIDQMAMLGALRRHL